MLRCPILPILALSSLVPAFSFAQTPTPTAQLGALAGKVICGDTGRLARGAIVTLNFIPGADFSVPQIDLKDATKLTGADGSYRFPHLPPGQYAVTAILPGYVTGMQDTFDTSAQLFSDSTDAGVKNYQDRLRQALSRLPTAIVVPGKTESLDITLQRGAALSGRVRYADDTPAPQVILMLEKIGKKPATTNEERMMENIMANVAAQFTNQRLSPDDRGVFRLYGIEPGKYRLVVSQPSQGSGRDGVQVTNGTIFPDPHATRFYAGDTFHLESATQFDLHGGEEINDIVITLPLGTLHVIRGTVRSADGRPLDGAQLTLTDASDSTLQYFAGTENDGAFRFLQVPPGQYQLVCDHAFIGRLIPVPNQPNVEQEEYLEAFAGQTHSVTVLDSDVSGLDFALKPMPMPAELKLENRDRMIGPPQNTQPH